MKFKLLYVLLSVSVISSAQIKPTQAWLDQKFSMFIHFGLYSVYGGVYEGKPVERGYSEQIQSFAGIFSDWYASTATEFNPTQWNADSIVSLAKQAGMKSIVFTSKHHDGFCMYHSQFTDFNIVDATPYGKDLMKELSDACLRGGIDFGVYYSLIDWHFPQAYPISSHNADPLTPEHFAYNKKQVEEIMTHYGDISEIWFDMGSLTQNQSKELYQLVTQLQPQCMISGRLGNDYVDFSVMADNKIPNYKLGVPWQTAASFFDETWGYRSWQERGSVYAKVDEKIRSLIKVISCGGNYLLNIGPRGDGSIVEFENEVLKLMGEWIKINGEAIYGTTANPFHQQFTWGDITAKDDALYLFVTDAPSSNEIPLKGYEGKVIDVKLLANNQNCNFTETRDGLKIQLPLTVNSNNINVLKVCFEDSFHVKPTHVIHSGLLEQQNAMLTFGHSSKDYYNSFKSLIRYDWNFKTSKKRVNTTLHFSENEIGKDVIIHIDGKEQRVKLYGERSRTVTLPKKDVKLGGLFTKRGKGVFGDIEEENGQLVPLDTLYKNWKEIPDFAYGKSHNFTQNPYLSSLFLQEIESTRTQTVAVEVGGSYGVYLLLNGTYLTAHFSDKAKNGETEIVFLPLKKGKNQLVIKYFNRFEKELLFSIKLLDKWSIYSQSLAPVDLNLKPIHNISVELMNPPSAVAPLKLNNLSLQLF